MNHLSFIRKTLDLLSKKYEQILLKSDFNIVKCDKPVDYFCNIYNLCGLIKVPICYKNPSKPTRIDVMLTNLPKSYYNSCTVETTLSDFHKMTVIIMKTTFRKQEPNKIDSKDYKKFSSNAFREDLPLEVSSNGHSSEPDNPSSFINVGVKALNNHAPVKKRQVRVNEAQFMNTSLKKTIMHCTKPRNIFLRNRFDENIINFNKQRN